MCFASVHFLETYLILNQNPVTNLNSKEVMQENEQIKAIKN